MLPKSGFSIDYIMHLDIDFHKLMLTRGSSYIELPRWLTMKKAVTTVIAALHYEEIGKNSQRVSKLKPFIERYNWKGLKFPMALNKIGKFEKNNPGIAVNVIFMSEKRIFIARRSKFNSKRDKQVNLLMITDGENKHYTTVKSLSKLLKSMNATDKDAYHFCMNCLNGFRTESARDKHYKYCSNNGEVKVKMPEEKDKWLRFHDDQCQFKVPFILYADFESILKAVGERYKDKMGRIKAERKGGASFTDKINTHVPSWWCVYSKFAYGDVPDPLELYRGEGCVNRFVDHVEKEIKRLYKLYPQQPMAELTDVLLDRIRSVRKLSHLLEAL